MEYLGSRKKGGGGTKRGEGKLSHSLVRHATMERRYRLFTE